MEAPADGVAVVSAVGEHDVASAPRLRTAIDQALADTGAVVVDLTPSTFVDSTVLGVLLGVRDRVGREGGGFAALLAPEGSEEVRRILHVTGLGPVLPVLASRQEALASARAGRR